MKGKDKCNLLRQIRREIAEANNIVYLSADCDYQGECKGTCPLCDAEIKYLDNELNEKAAKGEKVTLSGISLNTYNDTMKIIKPSEKKLSFRTNNWDDICEGGLEEVVDFNKQDYDDEDEYPTMGNMTPIDIE